MDIKKKLLFGLLILPFAFFALRKWYFEYKIDFLRDEGLKFQTFFGWLLYNSYVTPFKSFSLKIKKNNENPKLNPAASFQVRADDSDEIKLFINKHSKNRYYLIISFILSFLTSVFVF